MMVSSPGLGKSSLHLQTAARIGYDPIIFYPALSDITAIKGFPVLLEDNQAEWIPYGDLRRILEATKPTMVLFDDAGQALPSMQGGMMQILQARQIDGRRIPDCVHFSVATNSMSDMSASYGIIDAVKDRCLIFNMVAHWKPVFDHGKVNGFHPLILGFLAFQKNEIFKVGSPSQEVSHHTRTTPRSLERLSRMIKLCQANSLNGPQIKSLIFASVDPVNAASFLKYLQDRVEVEAIFDNPNTAPLVTDYKLLVVVKCLAREASGNLKKIEAGLNYLERTNSYEAIAVYLTNLNADELEALVKNNSKLINTALGK